MLAYISFTNRANKVHNSLWCWNAKTNNLLTVLYNNNNIHNCLCSSALQGYVQRNPFTLLKGNQIAWLLIFHVIRTWIPPPFCFSLFLNYASALSVSVSDANVPRGQLPFRFVTLLMSELTLFVFLVMERTVGWNGRGGGFLRISTHYHCSPPPSRHHPIRPTVDPFPSQGPSFPKLIRVR